MINYNKFLEAKKENLYHDKKEQLEKKFMVLIQSLENNERNEVCFNQLQNTIIGFKNQIIEFAKYMDLHLTNGRTEINQYNNQFVENLSHGYFDNQKDKISNIGQCFFGRLNNDKVSEHDIIAMASELRQLNNKLYDLSLYLRIFNKEEQLKVA